MKRTFLFLLVAVLMGVGLQSCNKENQNGGTTSVQWVDLGLPSGLLWADRNVGAIKPEDYGSYFAWGESAPKQIYEWSTYLYGNNYDMITKYCNLSDFGLNGFTDNLTTLVASDDAAAVNIGGGAHTPSKDEWQELLDNTTGTWTTRNGVYGRLLTASNGKSIFLPTAGVRYGTGLYRAGEYGHYWSSTLNMENPNDAWYFYLLPDFLGMNIELRFHGFSVRAVRAK